MATEPDLDLFAPAAIDDPYPLYERLRSTAPVHRVPGTDFHLVSTWDLVEEAAERVEDFSNNLRGIMVQGADGAPERMSMDLDGEVEQVLATADGAAHKGHRKFVLKALGRRFRVLESTIEKLVERNWDAYARDGRIDWVEAMADRLPPAVLVDLLGLPQEELPHLLKSAYESVEMLSGVVPPDRLEYLLDSTMELVLYLEQRLTDAEKSGPDGLLRVLAEAVIAGDIESGTAVMVLIQLVGAGAETTAGLIGSAARQLALNPEIQQRLRVDPALVDPFLDECLRLDPPLRGHYRVVTRDTRLGGVELRENDHLLLLWSAANRDPARFEDPDAVVLDRAGIRGHMSFGKGKHFCVGSSLARIEATAAIRVLLERTRDFTVDPDAPPTWVPSVIVRRHAKLELTYSPA